MLIYSSSSFVCPHFRTWHRHCNVCLNEEGRGTVTTNSSFMPHPRLTFFHLSWFFTFLLHQFIILWLNSYWIPSTFLWFWHELEKQWRKRWSSQKNAKTKHVKVTREKCISCHDDRSVAIGIETRSLVLLFPIVNLECLESKKIELSMTQFNLSK